MPKKRRLLPMVASVGIVCCAAAAIGIFIIKKSSTPPASVSDANTTRIAQSTTTISLSTPSTTQTSAPVKVAEKVSTPDEPTSTLLAASSTAASRAPIVAPLADQTALSDSVVAIVCTQPYTGNYFTGTGVIVNANGYVLTNAHVLGNGYQTYCYLGRARDATSTVASRHALPTIAIYYSLSLIAEGKLSGADTDENLWASSTHDFAILKIGQKMSIDDYDPNQTPMQIQILEDAFIPFATDAEFAAFSPNGKYPPITINYDYQPVVGDLLSLGGYIGQDATPEYTFADGHLDSFTSSSILVDMPTGQGFSGSPVVDNNGEMVALNHATDCDTPAGCTAITEGDDLSFLYGNNSLAITIPALNAAMEEDAGFGLQQLQTMP